MTLVAGAFVIAAGLAGLWQLAGASTAALLATRLALLVGIALLVVGRRSRPGLFRASPAAALALVLLPVCDLVSGLSLAMVRGLDQLAVLGPVLFAVQVMGLAGGLVAAVLVVRRRLLDRGAAWSLVAVVGLRVVFAVASVAPLLDEQLALGLARAYVVVPLAVLAFGVGLLLHGRATGVRTRIDGMVDAWRSSTDVS
ncbi:hypothetical protein [Frigoribacterium sp. PhB24]|uniref:hypothetical protein n=1 Tax=Frigoribacterium sp. PhB24 TaxID=2485204 RepID=UPI0011CE1612|nr:hypothetical protein [Frigoribacterium sp. PhB24]